VDSALRLPGADFTVDGTNRLGQGVEHNPWGCAPLKAGGLDCSADFLLNDDGPAYDSSGNVISGNVDEGKGTALLDYDAVETHPAFKVVDGLQCGVISFPDDNTYGAAMTNRLRNRMRTQMSAMLMFELVSGWASNGPSLSQGTALGTVLSIDDAATVMEEHLAIEMHGNTGYVYIPPQLLHRAVNIDWVQIVNGRLETVTGHVVVSDAGHLGDAGPTAPSAGQFWMFTSGQVGYGLTDTMLLGEVSSDTWDSSTNVRQRLAEAYAQLVFDPCPTAAILVDLGTDS